MRLTLNVIFTIIMFSVSAAIFYVGLPLIGLEVSYKLCLIFAFLIYNIGILLHLPNIFHSQEIDLTVAIKEDDEKE